MTEEVKAVMDLGREALVRPLIDFARPSDDDPRMSNGYCLTHGDYNGRLLRCPDCHEARLIRDDWNRVLSPALGAEPPEE